MINKFLTSIFTILFLVSGFSQTEKKADDLSATNKKNKIEKASKKTIELRKKLLYGYNQL